MITAAFVLAILALVMLIVGLILAESDVHVHHFFGIAALAALVALCVLAIVQFGVAQ